MAGLLDMFNNISPEQNQGLLAAAAQILQNSGPSRVPVGIGQALGTGMQAYQQTMEANRVRRLDEQRQAQQDAFQQEYRTVQMDGLKSQKAEREAKLKFDQARQEAVRRAIKPDGTLDNQALVANLAPFDPEGAMQIVKDLAPKPVTYATNPVEVTGPDGRPMLIQPASDGSDPRVVKGFRPWVKPEKPSAGPAPTFSAELGGFVAPPSASNPQGSFSPVPGITPKAAKPIEPTEGERKAATLHMRMEGSLAQLNKAVEEDPAAASPSLAASRLRAIGLDSMANKVNSGPRQRVEAAQLDLLDAGLTLATGAAYTKEQLESHRATYFPQINDDKKTIEDKADRLQTMLKAARLAAGRAAPGAGNNTPNQFASGAKVATLADITETARKSGKTTAEVTAALKAKGYTIKGQ